ncbi:MAG: trehalose-phosphatase, partial [Agromyces sp.]
LQVAAKARVEAEIPELTVRGGKGVIEFSVRPSDKGEALNRLRQHAGASAVIYVGDDVTDEDAFAALESEDLGVKVGQGRSLAAHRVRSPEDVADLLERLADARETTHGGPSRWP